VEGTSQWGKGGVSHEGWSPSRSGGNLLVKKRWGFSRRLVSPKERREPLDGRRWGFSGRLVSLEERREPLGEEKVGFLGKVGLPQGAEGTS